MQRTSSRNGLSEPESEPQGVLRLRALLIGIPLVVAVCLLSVFADLITKSIQVGVMQIAPPAVAILFVLVLGNLLSKKLVKRDFLNPSDLIIIYGMLTVAVLVSTRGMMKS